jgi:hypothetical protein
MTARAADVSGIHRLLDEAFAQVTMTAEAQDLKEELRANLAARCAELVERGTDPRAAAQAAFVELGDLDDALASLARDTPTSTGAHPVTGGQGPDHQAGQARIPAYPSGFDQVRAHKVRPKPAFVVRAGALGLVFTLAAAEVVVTALTRAGVASWSWVDLSYRLGLTAGFLAGVASAVLVADALRQETTVHYPLPRHRAAAYGGSAGVLVIGLGLGGLGAAAWAGTSSNPGQAGDTWWLLAGIVAVVVATVAFVVLGVTQTNRTKPWALDQARQWEMADRFSTDHNAAARFGMYAAAILVVAVAGFIALSVTVGFVWSWLALVGGFAALFVVLARMLFSSKED